MRASTSTAVAAPLLTIMLGCFGQISAALTTLAGQPGLLDEEPGILPGRILPDGGGREGQCL